MLVVVDRAMNSPTREQAYLLTCPWTKRSTLTQSLGARDCVTKQIQRASASSAAAAAATAASARSVRTGQTICGVSVDTIRPRPYWWRMSRSRHEPTSILNCRYRTTWRRTTRTHRESWARSNRPGLERQRPDAPRPTVSCTCRWWWLVPGVSAVRTPSLCVYIQLGWARALVAAAASGWFVATIGCSAGRVANCPGWRYFGFRST